MNTSDTIFRLGQVLRRQHKTLSTEKSYAFWLGRYMEALRQMPPDLPSEQKLERFLTDLACRQNVSASTQNQAFNAILFFYREGRLILGSAFGCLVLLWGASRRLPTSVYVAEPRSARTGCLRA